MDESIRTHSDNIKQLTKNGLIENSLNNILCEPKSSIHEIKIMDGSWKPRILLSTLAEIHF